MWYCRMYFLHVMSCVVHIHVYICTCMYTKDSCNNSMWFHPSWVIHVCSEPTYMSQSRMYNLVLQVYLQAASVVHVCTTHVHTCSIHVIFLHFCKICILFFFIKYLEAGRWEWKLEYKITYIILLYILCIKEKNAASLYTYLYALLRCHII